MHKIADKCVQLLQISDLFVSNILSFPSIICFDKWDWGPKVLQPKHGISDERNRYIQYMLNGTYTKMLRKATNVKWWERKTNAEVYEELPLLGNKIAARRMKLTGRCHRHPKLAASDLVLWQPNQNLRRRGRPKVDFVEVLRQDAGNLTTTELHIMMEDQTVWRNHVTACL